MRKFVEGFDINLRFSGSKSIDSLAPRLSSIVLLRRIAQHLFANIGPRGVDTKDNIGGRGGSVLEVGGLTGEIEHPVFDITKIGSGGMGVCLINDIETSRSGLNRDGK